MKIVNRLIAMAAFLVAIDEMSGMIMMAADTLKWFAAVSALGAEVISNTMAASLIMRRLSIDSCTRLFSFLFCIDGHNKTNKVR